MAAALAALVQEWQRSSQVPNPNNNNGRRLLRRRALLGAPQNEVCWKRVITVTAVGEELKFGKGTVMEQARVCSMLITSNEIRRQLLFQVPPATRQQIKANIQTLEWATGIRFPAAYAEMVLNCAQPPPGTAAAVGGVWHGQDSYSPGMCVTCASLYAIQQQHMRGLQVLVCNRTRNNNNNDGDCCMGCAPATHMRIEQPTSSGNNNNGLGFICAERCRPGSAYTAAKRCVACAAGLYSTGGLGQCVTCSVLVGEPNAWVDARQGCRICGARAAVSSAASACIPCVSGKYVPAGQTACTTCASAGYFVPPFAPIVKCTPCPAGTFSSSRTQLACTLCHPNTHAALLGSTVCADCPVGYLSAYNRSTCTPCATINATLMPFAEYYQRGCAIRCQPVVSYVRISPYSPHGCASCADNIAVPIGRYADANDCTITPQCTNLPVSNAYYTTGSPVAGNSQLCGWACNAGFFAQGLLCSPCVFDTSYNIERHRPLIFIVGGAVCQYTCKQGIYLDPQRACDKPCTDLLTVLTLSRVRQYTTTAAVPRPNFIHGVCGNDAALLPRAEVRFLRLGSWAYLSPSASSIAQQCGNSLLNDGEGCDDGNRASGDGCSALCAVETASPDYWECDLIGAPCVRNCGWSLASPEPNGIGLLGYALPSCSSAAAAGGALILKCGCADLSYRYSVAQLSPKVLLRHPFFFFLSLRRALI